MKTNNPKLASSVALAAVLVVCNASWAQTINTTPTPGAAVPNTVAPSDPNAGSQTVTDTSSGQSVNSADAVLKKLKENASPVTINDMIQAQDVITRLDLITQIQDKIAKSQEAANKASQTTALSSLSGSLGADGTSSAAAETLRRASSNNGLPSLDGRSSGPPRVLAISGSGGEYSALVQVDGHPMSVKNGSSIPGMGTINDISPKGITVSQANGKTTTLGFTQN